MRMKGNEGKEFRDGTVLSRRKRFGWHSMGCRRREGYGRMLDEFLYFLIVIFSNKEKANVRAGPVLGLPLV